MQAVNDVDYGDPEVDAEVALDIVQYNCHDAQ